MFNRVEFSDLYKFLTSIGLILIAGALAIQWLFISPDNAVSISQEHYDSLIESSKKLTDEQISAALSALKILPYLTVIIFLTGLALSSTGIYNWHKKQKNLDELDDLGLIAKRLEIRELNAEEIETKAEKEVEHELSSDAVETMQLPNPRMMVTISDMVISLKDIEGLIFQKIVDYNFHKYSPKANVRIGSQELDIVMSSLFKNERPDILIEIKYMQNRLSMEMVESGYKTLHQAWRDIFRSSHERTKGLLIIIYKEGIANSEELERFEGALSAFQAKPMFKVYLKLIFRSDKDISKLDVTTLVDERK